MISPNFSESYIISLSGIVLKINHCETALSKIKEVIINEDNYSVSKNTERIVLPKKEFQLLHKLVSYPSRIFTRSQLMEDIWGLDVETDERTVDVHIKRLREKFESWEEFEISTVRGLGYKVEIIK